MLETLSLKIKFQELECVEYPKGVSKPYLWMVQFKADGSCIKITDKFLLEGKADFQFSHGSHGNLATPTLTAGYKTAIPKSVGEWQIQLKPLRVPYFEQNLPATFGVLAVLLEENNVSDQGAEAGHTALNKEVVKAVGEVIKSFDPKQIKLDDIESSMKTFFESKIEPYTKSIPQKVINAIQEGQNIFQNIWSLVKKDEFIGVHVWTHTHSDFSKNKKQLLLEHTWKTKNLGAWKIRGTVEKV